MPKINRKLPQGPGRPVGSTGPVKTCIGGENQDCPRKAVTKGMCSTHYQAHLAGKEVNYYIGEKGNHAPEGLVKTSVFEVSFILTQDGTKCVKVSTDNRTHVVEIPSMFLDSSN